MLTVMAHAQLHGGGRSPLGGRWPHLVELIRGLAEGYAEADPERALAYLDDAEAFCRQPESAGVADLGEHWGRSDSLRQAWFRSFGRG